MPARRTRRRPEPAIALINIVFLLLVFFLVASRIAPPLPAGLELVEANALTAAAPPEVLVVQADGSLWQAGRPTDPGAALATAGDGPLRVMPDRSLPAAQLLGLARELRAGGAPAVILVGARSGPEPAP